MKVFWKSLVIGIGLICLSFQAHSLETSSYAKVVSSEPVWSVKTFSKPITRDKCVQNHASRTDYENLVGDMIIGGLIGAAIGNAVSDVHGMGAVGTSLGALFVADNHSQRSSGYKCTSKTVYSERQEKVISHYNVKVRLKNKFITFQSERPFERHSFVKVRSTESYSLVN